MEILADCLKAAKVWTRGTAVVAAREVVGHAGLPPWMQPLLSAIGMECAYVVETPIGDPVVAADDEQAFLKMVWAEQWPALTFYRTLTPPRRMWDPVICTADKYIVDPRPFPTLDAFIDGLAQSAHRKSVRRFSKTFIKAGACLKTLLPTEAVGWTARLLPLHMEVQRRNGGTKDDTYLHALLEACRDHSNDYFCVVAMPGDGHTSSHPNEGTDPSAPLAFGIYVLEKHTRFTAVDGGAAHASLFLALVGNSRDRGGKVSAYHNILLEGVRRAQISGAVMDFGLSHWSVKKVFEPQRVPQYLAYVGSSTLVDAAFRATHFLQAKNIVQSPLQPE